MRKCDRSISLVRAYSDLPPSQLTRVGSSRIGVTARMALKKSRDNHQTLVQLPGLVLGRIGLSHFPGFYYLKPGLNVKFASHAS
jgi:hypothetical protein